ncbi:hypothetical protein RAA17_25005 [Komagataeibacter rhaeticus]|nr:hypothetical protein [Komagataeibacter rhaeticus]
MSHHKGRIFQALIKILRKMQIPAISQVLFLKVTVFIVIVPFRFEPETPDRRKDETTLLISLDGLFRIQSLAILLNDE